MSRFSPVRCEGWESHGCSTSREKRRSRAPCDLLFQLLSYLIFYPLSCPGLLSPILFRCRGISTLHAHSGAQIQSRSGSTASKQANVELPLSFYRAHKYNVYLNNSKSFTALMSGELDEDEGKGDVADESGCRYVVLSADDDQDQDRVSGAEKESKWSKGAGLSYGSGPAAHGSIGEGGVGVDAGEGGGVWGRRVQHIAAYVSQRLFSASASPRGMVYTRLLPSTVRLPEGLTAVPATSPHGPQSECPTVLRHPTSATSDNIQRPAVIDYARSKECASAPDPMEREGLGNVGLSRGGGYCDVEEVVFFLGTGDCSEAPVGVTS